ncbi:O-antigen ligase family protein [Staphylococcus gallinarum]|uniref:O-antigen ligase family protein n=1 Tax=Staphylococcus gallinarum TaxID=1293 RepID=UPI001E397121|nr:O-antigen ligase family protein [Staphylococcus gallinarum]MCD8843898.1 O-antigen ligase family protein [Staphylococcus gallinarum]
MKYLILLAIVSMNAFIIVSTFFKEKLNINIDGFYFTTMIIIEMLVFIYIISKILYTKKLNKNYLYLAILVLLICSAYYFSPFKHDELSTNNILFFILWALPASICGVEMHNLKKEKVDRFFKVIFSLFSICLIFIILIPYITGNLPSYINFGLMNYQNVSYIAAFTFGLGMYFFTEKATSYKFYYIIMSFIMIPIIFIASGRGGAILLIIYIIVVSMGIVRNKRIPNVNKILFVSIILILVVSIMSIAISFDKEGRTFSYLTSSGISLDQTSGREDVYGNDIQYIKQKPLLGYGLFNYYHLINNIPHNIVFELMLIGGVFGTSIIAIIVAFILKKFRIHYDKNSTDRLAMFLSIYPLTLLMFSSNFLVVSEFWFAIFYFLAKPKVKLNE